MRRTVIALIIVLPLLFVFVIFSSVSLTSLGVEIAANGISILNKDALNGTMRIDLADRTDGRSLEVEVLPKNASDKRYTFEVEEIEDADFADVTVDKDGNVNAKREGAARISAVSNDGGYRDSIIVLVGSSKAYDFDINLSDESGDPIVLTQTEEGYSADVLTGRLRYSVSIHPGVYTSLTVKTEEGAAIVEEGSKAITLPLSGKNVLRFVVPDGIDGNLEKTLTLNATKRADITVNGSRNYVVAVSKGSPTAEFYFEADEMPVIDDNAKIKSHSVSAAGNGYKIRLELNEMYNDFEFDIFCGSEKIEMTVSFKDFVFEILSDNKIVDDEVSVIAGASVTFYAMSATPTDGVRYEWGIGGIVDVTLTPSENTASCEMLPSGKGQFVLWAEAYRDDVSLGGVELVVNSVDRVYNVRIANDVSCDLAGRYTIGGYTYNEGNSKENLFPLDVRTFYDASGSDKGSEDISDLDAFVSDESKAEIVQKDGKAYIKINGTGEVSVTFAWKGNDTFGVSYVATLTFNAVKNGVEVSTSPDLIEAARAGYEIVLNSDIMLGTDRSGSVLPLDSRKNLIGKMKSTYNTKWYENSGKSDCYISYALEFKDNVYGNGHTISAEHIAAAHDSTGLPTIFKGPLFFVSKGGLASVAGQDNCSFLIRTDGVTLYGVNLLGCNDESLYNDEKKYDLTMLNNVGTVLEINGSARIINCRVRNGRNCVRVYGGNRNGNNYFVTKNGEVDDERINVELDGCVISQAREFLVKAGANKALQASEKAGGPEPDLTDADGKKYEAGKNYLDDEYFYSHYVMTDLTVKDSVLETSGLFAIGVETNFSGAMLYKDAPSPISGFGEWMGTGGTSFATVVRLSGDVRIYDWKNIQRVDSSTLIESVMDEKGNPALPWGRLDIAAMIKFVREKFGGKYNNIAFDEGDVTYIHGGIAFYGGGKNYSQLSLEDLDESYRDFTEYDINISVLASADESLGYLKKQGELLPLAAGTNDFRFFIYGSDSANSYHKQLGDAETGAKYSGVKKYGLF